MELKHEIFSRVAEWNTPGALIYSAVHLRDAVYK